MRLAILALLLVAGRAFAQSGQFSGSDSSKSQAPLPPPPPPPVASQSSSTPLPPPPPPLSSSAPASAPESAYESATPAAAADTPTATPEAGPEAPAGKEKEFVKGDLTSVGVNRLDARKTRVIAAFGYQDISNVRYALVYPQLEIRSGDFSIGVGAPLSVEVFSSNYPTDGSAHVVGFNNAGSIRKEDWDETSEWARVLTYLTYGHKEDHLYFNAGQRHTSTMGHGSIMRRYTANIDVNTTRVGGEMDAYNDYAGFELMTNDLIRWSVLGGVAFLKPLSLISDHWMAKSFSLGAVATMDREAPTRLQFESEPPCPVPGACHPANIPVIDSTHHFAADRMPLPIVGADAELKLVKTEGADLKVYGDFAQMMVTGLNGEQGGHGWTVGLLGRFNVGTETVSAFRLVAEARLLGKGYRPGYFDGFYEIDKYLDGGTGGSSGEPLTKLASTLQNTVDRKGYYLEGSWGIREAIGLTLALEGDSAGPQKNFLIHLEIPALSWLQVFGTVSHRGFIEADELLSLDDKTVAFAGARIKLLPILFVNARAFRSFQLDAYKSSLGTMGSLKYRTVGGIEAAVEWGWEF